MDIYFKKRRWKTLIFLVAVFIGIASTFYTNSLVKKLADEERQKVITWANALKALISAPSDFQHYNLTESELKYQTDVIDFLSDIITKNTTIPIIVVDADGTINNYGNISNHSEKNLERVLNKMKEQHAPIEIVLSTTDKQYAYYRESNLLVALKIYPYIQLLVIFIFIGVSYFAFSSSRKAEQNLVWVGMAKETAHQLGTPISSVLAWIELLKDEHVNPEIITELTKDTERLEKIAERFSKVGSIPELYPENMIEVLQQSVDYLKARISKKIELTLSYPQVDEMLVPISKSLFSWVIENIVKNSVDAMEGQSGKIELIVVDKHTEIQIDIIDNGKGIPKSKFKTIFNPGFTTKKRGWGLGLSLSKRIIEIYHRGRLILKSSESNVKTNFRITLKK